MPEMPALKAYEETTRPNCLGEIFSDLISISPSGDMIMKSSTTVN